MKMRKARAILLHDILVRYCIEESNSQAPADDAKDDAIKSIAADFLEARVDGPGLVTYQAGWKQEDGGIARDECTHSGRFSIFWVEPDSD